MNVYVRLNPRPGTLTENERPAVGEKAADEVEMTSEELRAWIAAQPKEPYPVSKDTIISRVIAMGALSSVMAALASQSAEDQFIWNQSAWFWSTNQTIRGMAAQLGLDGDALLAPDPFL